MSDKISLARKDAISTFVGVKVVKSVVFRPKTANAARVFSIDEVGSETRLGVETDPRWDLGKALW